jgi:hypothetical protein
MRNYFSLFLALLATTSGLYLTWRFTQPELNGHWHIIQDGSDINPGIATLDIDWKNQVVADKFKVGGFGIGGPLDRFQRHIFLFPTCLSLELDISWKGDTLILKESNSYRENHKDVLKAVRYTKGECTAEGDHFLRSGKHISLPALAPDDEKLPYQSLSLGLVLAPALNGAMETFDSYGRRMVLSEIVEEAEKMGLKNYDGSLTVVSLFADESISDKQINEVVEVFEEEGKGRKIYRVRKSMNDEGLLQFYWAKNF